MVAECVKHFGQAVPSKQSSKALRLVDYSDAQLSLLGESRGTRAERVRCRLPRLVLSADTSTPPAHGCVLPESLDGFRHTKPLPRRACSGGRNEFQPEN